MKIYKYVIAAIKNIIFKDTYIGKFYINAQTNTKYKLDSVLCDILYILKTGISWRDLRSNIKWTSAYWHYQRFIKRNIFKKLYFRVRNKALYKFNTNVLLIDSSVIVNKYGTNKISRNKFYKNKKCNKISCVTTENGIPLSISVNKGSLHDLRFTNAHIKDLQKTFSKNECNYFLADKAYVSSKLRNKLKFHKCELMVPTKINQKTKHLFDKNIYKKRINIEHTFAQIKHYRRISIRYDKFYSSYMGFVYLGFSCLLLKHSQ